jgi:deazaflavin-dependent oxidoreductase (nitroreductase family)
MDLAREELSDDATIDITTIGRRSGQPRRIEIWMFDIEGRFFITGTPGPRSWVANLIANPSLTVHLKRKAHVDLPAHATVVTDAETRRYVIAHRRPILERWGSDWASGQDDEALVADSPMVEVVFDPPPA